MKYRIRKIFFVLIGIGFVTSVGVLYYPRTNSLATLSQLPVLQAKTAEAFRSHVVNHEILPHPLNLADAEQLVEDLRLSKPVGISPINLNYKRINISQASMKCSKEQSNSLKILVLIKTRTSEGDLRTRLRRLLRNQTNSSKLGARFQYGFLIGKPYQSIMAEISKHKDFVIGDFSDTYRNLTYKTMMGIRWAMEYCPFHFYVSMDVDMYVFLDNVIKFLKDPYNYPYDVRANLKLGEVVSPDEHFYAGDIFKPGHHFPIRQQKSRYYLSKRDYPPDVFPAYASGRIVMMSKKTVSSFYYLSPYVQHIGVDDVYLGLLANKLCIEPFPGYRIVVHAVHKGSYREELKDKLAIHKIGDLENQISEKLMDHFNPKAAIK